MHASTRAGRPTTSLVVVLSVALLALLTACSGGSSGQAALPTVSGTANDGVDGVRAPSDAAGGTLRVVTSQIDSLDPQRSYLPAVWNLMRLYVRTLVTYSTEPGHTDELVPDLATDLGTVSDGGLTWTFTLRDGVDFATGRAITSRDVKYGIERSFASDVVVGGPTYVVDLFDDPDDQYVGPYQDESADKLGLASIQTPDDRTIVFRLRAPAPDLPYVLALPSSSPVPIEADTGPAYGSGPVSSGPYLITSIDPVAGVVLDRNPAWDPATDPVRTALPDRVVVRSGLSGADRDQAVLAGSADLDVAGSGVQQATISRMDGDPALADRADDVLTGSLRLLALPTTVAPFDNPACRAAVAAVVDRRALQQTLGGAGTVVRSSQLFPRVLPGAPEDPDPAADPAAAQAALAACGQPGGFSTVIAVPDTPMNALVGNELAAELSTIGIQAEVRPLDARTFYAAQVGSPDNVTAQGFGIVLATWRADFPTASSFLVPLVASGSVRAVANTNYARLTDAGVDSLVQAAQAAEAAAADPLTAAAAALPGWLQVAQSAVATGAYVPLAEDRIQLVAGQRLHNAVVMLPYSSYDLATAGVA